MKKIKIKTIILKIVIFSKNENFYMLLITKRDSPIKFLFFQIKFL